MSVFAFTPEALNHSSVRVRWIVDYWTRIRGDRPLPCRSDFDPVDIPHHLPGLMLIDVEGERPGGTGIYRYRVVGEWEVISRGFNPTGQLVDEGYYGPSLDSALSDYDTVRKTGQPLYAPLDFVDSRGLHVDEFSVLLPFSENGSVVTQILIYSERRSRKQEVSA